MSAQRLTEVRAASVRVALAATGLVAAGYLLIAIAVVFLATRDLTAQIDARLAESVSRAINAPAPPSGQGFQPPSVGPRFGPQLLVWRITASGTVEATDQTAVLPVQYRDITDPTTIALGDTSVRVRGAVAADGDHVIVGQSMATVSQAQSTVILAELGIAPVLLAIVFLGAVAIGRRVAAPIALARQRQLDFTADASHELRTPLSVIEAQTSLALSQERDVSWYRTAFARVGHESKRMRRLIEDLLWLARFDATSGPPRSEPVDVGVLAAQAVDRFTILAESRRLRLSLQTAPGNNVVTAPPEWLDRLLGVLLDNACKYSREDGIVGVSVASEGQRIRLTVDDSGPGIPEAERQLVFDRFHRATDAASGAGLGLAIADAIVKATNGQWRVGSSSSGGASMSVSWQRSFPEVRETVAASRASSPQRSANS